MEIDKYVYYMHPFQIVRMSWRDQRWWPEDEDEDTVVTFTTSAATTTFQTATDGHRMAKSLLKVRM